MPNALITTTSDSATKHYFTAGIGNFVDILAMLYRANHEGNLWTHVVSLRREDAERMGYTSAETWRDLVLEKLPTIADAMRIPARDLRWYAAYHDKASNPHIHMIVYSADPTRGYLTESNIEKMRSSFAHSIYKDEFMHIYERKDLVRSQLNEFATERLKELANAVDGSNSEIVEMLAALGSQLHQAKGKKLYGYLKPALKAQVDEIVKRLASDPHIDEMYHHWCGLTAEVKRIYTSKIDVPPPLEHEQTFKTIKNMVIRQAVAAVEKQQSLDLPEASEPEPEDIPEQELSFDATSAPESVSSETDRPHTEQRQRGCHATWSVAYKQARRYLYGQGVSKDFAKAYDLFAVDTEGGNALALHDLGYMHQHGLGMEQNMETAQAWYAKAYHAFCAVEEASSTPYLQYRIGKLHRDGYGTPQDYTTAASWFGKAAEKDNQYAQYSLGSLYRRGLGVEQDDYEALRLFTLSADQGNAYAAYELAGMYEKGIATVADPEIAQAHYTTAFHAFRYMETEGADDKLQHRLGKMLLDGKGVEPDAARAAEYFHKAAENSNQHAQYQLGKLYLKGNGVEQSREIAVEFFTLAAAQGNEYAQWFLDHMNDYPKAGAGALLRALAQLIQSDYEQQRQQYEHAVDRKLMAKIRRKKQELGQRFE